jgi:flagellar biosynthetic protein FliR
MKYQEKDCLEITIAQAQVYLLTLTRIMASIIHVPVLGGRSIPNQIKIALGILLTMLIVPTQPIPASVEIQPALAFAIAIGKEILIGTIVGFAAVLTFGVFQITGNLIGSGSGLNAGQILNPALEENGTSLDQIFVITAMLIFLVINGHYLFILGIQKSFLVIPINGTMPDFSLEVLIRMTSGLITSGVQMSIPIMATLLLSDMTLGLLSRVAPQVQIFFLGIPLKIGLGLVVLSMTLVILLPTISTLLSELAARSLRLLGG